MMAFFISPRCQQPNQKRGENSEHANHRYRQPERRRWQDNHLREPGDRAGAGREESAADRRGPAGQPDHQPGPPPAGQAALYPVRRNGPYPDGRAATPRRRYEDFLRRHGNAKVVYLELGVGGNTPVIIKYPFWKMTKGNPLATYVCINKDEAYVPRDIAKQSVGIQNDIGITLENIGQSI